MIIEGQSAVDQSLITGESMPISKYTGDDVLAGTINQQGGPEVQVTKLAKDSTIARLIRMVEEAQVVGFQAQVTIREPAARRDQSQMRDRWSAE
ncbi:MAG: hypothetical protein ACE5GO_03145 [Anaerolineales bacterium]